MMTSYMDTRWSKLKNYDFDDPEEQRAELRKFINDDPDSDDEEWLQQLQRDYGKRGKPSQPFYSRLSVLERYLLVCVVLAGIVTFSLVIAFIVNKSKGSPRHQSFTSTHELVANSNQYYVSSADRPCLTQDCIKASGHIIQNVDLKIDPCNNFYGYACNNWLSSTRVPPGHSTWTSFHEVGEHNSQILKRIFETINTHDSENSIFTKVKRHYDACMNKKMVERNGRAPLEHLINYVGSWSMTNGSLWKDEEWNFGQALNRIHHLKSMPLFYMYVGPDDKNSSRNIIQIEQAGISLSSKEFYLKKEHEKTILSYKELMIRVATLLGAKESEVTSSVDEVIDFERTIAKSFEESHKALQSPSAYHLMTVEELQDLCPAIPWLDYLNSMFSSKVPFDEKLVVYTPLYLKKMSDIVIRTERRILANYLVWHLIKPMLVLLSKPFRDASFAFMKEENGLESGEITWKTCVVQTDSVLGFATGHLFVRATEVDGILIKNKTEELLQYLRESLTASIRESDWMDSITKEKAVEKVEAISSRIGYPEWITNLTKLEEFYRNLTISDDPFQNYLNAREFYHERAMHRRGKPPVKDEWHMTPTEVNAYYNTQSNYVAFPLGVLQPPFFSLHLPMSINFGAVGSVMGHEINHGFDTQGRHFDKDGNMINWWSRNSTDMFEKRARCMENQYANMTVGKVKVDGTQTLAENMADNGGLQIAYRAYKDWVKLHGPEPSLPALNMTHEQLLYFGFAQVWCSMSTEKRTKNSLLEDRHSPGEIRVSAAVSNSVSFAKAYKCKPDTPMNPKHKCLVW